MVSGDHGRVLATGVDFGYGTDLWTGTQKTAALTDPHGDNTQAPQLALSPNGTMLAAVDHIVRGLGREDVQLCLIGSGPSLPALKAICTKLGLDPYVTFAGRAPDASTPNRVQTDAVIGSTRRGA